MESNPRIVYQKWLFVELVRLEHNFLYTKRNNGNSEVQVYFFEATEKLEQDIERLRKEGRKHE